MILHTERTHTSCSHLAYKACGNHQLFIRNYRPITSIPLTLLKRPQTELFHPIVNKRKKALPSCTKSSTLVRVLKENTPLMSERTTKENKIDKIDEFLTVCSDITNKSNELGMFSKHFEEYGTTIISKQRQQLQKPSEPSEHKKLKDSCLAD